MNSSRRAEKALISVGQMKDQALGKKTRMTQWLASVYPERVHSVERY